MTSAFTLCCLERGSFQEPMLRASLLRLMAASYADPAAQFVPAVARSTHLFTASAADGALAGFLFVARETCELDGERCPSIYVGLGLVAAEHRGAGLLVHLFRELERDARVWEGEAGRPLVIWAKTAVPGIPPLVARVFDLQPLADGSHDERGLAVAAMARRHYGRPLQPGEHPFVLRRVADSRYAASEVQRLQLGGPYAPLFERQAINERCGDRLVLAFFLRRRSSV